jgi:hypothetical protein
MGFRSFGADRSPRGSGAFLLGFKSVLLADGYIVSPFSLFVSMIGFQKITHQVTKKLYTLHRKAHLLKSLTLFREIYVLFAVEIRRNVLLEPKRTKKQIWVRGRWHCKN